MSLSWNEIRKRAIEFSQEWKDATRENSETQSFYNDFFNVFGINRRRIATFEEPVKKLGNKKGRIDLFWKGNLLVEQKSAGKHLGNAYSQALDYFPSLKEEELPRYVLVSDFQHFELYDLEGSIEKKFQLKDLYKNIEHFGFIAGYQKREFKDQDPVNIEASELMGKLHDQLKDAGYTGHELELLLVRLLFCLFADDTGIFEKDIFKEYVELKTKDDGSDLGMHISSLFQVLDTEQEKRHKTLDDSLNQFPHVNGSLFQEKIAMASFNSDMREVLKSACYFNWGKISPAIFGSLFQSVMDKDKRRGIGAHYTTEQNIMKIIKPLFLDELHEEFGRIKNNKNKLKEFHEKISKLKFLDPACGCGNFLILAYRELRLLEITVLKKIHENLLHKLKGGAVEFDVSTLSKIDVDTFYGIEIEEFPARIAEVAMWLIDHQMNMELSEAFGKYYARIPLKKSPHIFNTNALRADWNDLAPKEEISYILGNPPFRGAKYLSKDQRQEMQEIFSKVKSSGILDYVAAWYIKAANYIQGTQIQCAFVSTNSISQGEQVSVLWSELFNHYKIKIHFAHRTFAWGSEAKGKAHVHVVIIGFGNFDISNKSLYEYENITSESHEVKVVNINGYLTEGEEISAHSRTKPLCIVPEIVKGSESTDNGHFMLSKEEVTYLESHYPDTKNLIRPFIGGGDFINGNIRYCLWFKNAPINTLRKIPFILDRIEKVKKFREESPKERTRKWAEFPTLFSEDRQPTKRYLFIPKVSSERRVYIPFAYVEPEYIINNTASYIENASIFHFGILTSLMHMTWMRYVCGRLESRYIYSNALVYNTFPWPNNPSKLQIKEIEEKAQEVLDARKEFSDNSLADLYDPLTMPPKLLKAHKALDKAVDNAYRKATFESERRRIEFLFGLYKQYTAPLMRKEKKEKKEKIKTS